MKLNKEKIDRLCALNDRALWGEVREIARQHGFTLPDKTPSHEEMEKLRGAVTGGAKMNLGEAMRIINKHRRENG